MVTDSQGTAGSLEAVTLGDRLRSGAIFSLGFGGGGGMSLGSTPATWPVLQELAPDEATGGGDLSGVTAGGWLSGVPRKNLYVSASSW